MSAKPRLPRFILGLALVPLIILGCTPASFEESWSSEQNGVTRPLILPVGTASFRLATCRVQTSTPTRTPTPPPQPADGPLVWTGGENSLTMLGPDGWRTFEFQGVVRDIAIDAAGNAIVAPGLHICDGNQMRDLLPPAPGGEQDAVAVDPQGRIWVGYYGGIAVLEDGRWQPVPLTNTTRQARVVRDLAIDSRGNVWVATEAGLARYDGAGWRYYTERASPGAVVIYCLMVDRQDRVWVGHEKGLSVLRAGTWRHFRIETAGLVYNLATDLQGNTLAGSLDHGISLFNGRTWRRLFYRKSGLPSERITVLAVDGKGRIWVGTRFGLSVYDGQQWLTYQEANSGLGDNQVSALAIGRYPLARLPAPGSERFGRLVGRVTRAGQPVAGARVVLCSELSLTQSFGDSPCENAHFTQLGHTAADGNYAFEQIPAGHYAVAAEVEPGHWVARTCVLSAVRYRVQGSETAEAETIESTE